MEVFPRYEKYKDSGVEWLGKIPSHWEVKRLGYISDILQTRLFGTQLHQEDYIEDGIPVVTLPRQEPGAS